MFRIISGMFIYPRPQASQFNDGSPVSSSRNEGCQEIGQAQGPAEKILRYSGEGFNPSSFSGHSACAAASRIRARSESRGRIQGFA